MEQMHNLKEEIKMRAKMPNKGKMMKKEKVINKHKKEMTEELKEKFKR